MSRLRLLPVVPFLAAALLGCSDSTTEPTSIAGSYTASTFTLTPTGSTSRDVLAAGGSLTINIASSNAITGTLNVPASVTGGSAFVADMAGTATVTGSTVRFTQSADTFVRDLNWTIQGNTLRVTNQTAGSASFTITLTR